MTSKVSVDEYDSAFIETLLAQAQHDRNAHLRAITAIDKAIDIYTRLLLRLKQSK